MTFREVLEEISARVEGTRAVSLMGTDGIAIDTVNPGGLPLENIGAEFGSFFRDLRVSNTELDTGEVRQLTVMTDRYVTLLTSLTSDYFLLVILSADGNYGRARFEMAKAKFKLQDELI
ncbi:MAG TPA: roadblock/LC7 domain-containing protein [Thermoanaerobaculia bacterium]|nr:roadblock/LC7 domain-containing protein [Thermoanaerobaculia bacterium]